MPTRVKICGITRLEDAQLAVELGAAALGFNFYPPSRRYVAPAAAREIIRRLPPFVTVVGVFADETDGAHINELAEEAGVSVVQLHGPKFPADDAIGRYPVIRAFSIGDENDEDLPEVVKSGLRKVKKSLLPFGLPGGSESWAPAFLLDTADPVLRGGTGRTFDWKWARRIAQTCRVILAGGLTPENVGEAVRQVRPYAVDVATGVECAPGAKDPAKLRAFFAAVAGADRLVESRSL